MGKLTLKQEAFVQAYMNCGNASEAYRQAYDASRMKPETVSRKAAELLRNGKVTARLDALRAELADRHLWTREQSVKALTKVIEDPDRQADVIAAVRALNEMHGYNAPAKREITGPGGQPTTTRIVIDWGDDNDA